METRKQYGERVLATMRAMRANGATLKQVADALGVHFTTVWTWERGVCDPRHPRGRSRGSSHTTGQRFVKRADGTVAAVLREVTA